MYVIFLMVNSLIPVYDYYSLAYFTLEIFMYIICI